MRIVQVGAGLWGRSWAELVARARGFTLAGVVDSSREARAWAQAELGVPAVARLEQAPEADAVLLVSPPATHRPLAEQAFAAGIIGVFFATVVGALANDSGPLIVMVGAAALLMASAYAQAAPRAARRRAVG